MAKSKKVTKKEVVKSRPLVPKNKATIAKSRYGIVSCTKDVETEMQKKLAAKLYKIELIAAQNSLQDKRVQLTKHDERVVQKLLNAEKKFL